MIGGSSVRIENLVCPAEDINACRRLTTSYLRFLSREYARLIKAACPPGLHDVAKAVFPILKNMGASGTATFMRMPQLHVFLHCAAHHLRRGESDAASESIRSLLFQTLFEMSVEGCLPREGVCWPDAPPRDRCISPSRRAHGDFERTEYPITFRNHGFGTVGVHEGLLIQPSELCCPLNQRLVLSLFDTNPLSDFEAHPDKSGNQLSLGDASRRDWVESLQQAMTCVEEFMPLMFSEMSLILQQIVPVGTDDETHLSASYQESIGTLYMTLHPQPMTMVEALIHEFQHNKINMLFALDPVMHNAFSPLFTSPVRPDPRPLHGVLLAAHAFVPVAELYCRMREAGHPRVEEPSFHRRQSQIIQKNTDAIETLQRHAEWTDSGSMVMSDLVAYNEKHRRLIGT